MINSTGFFSRFEQRSQGNYLKEGRATYRWAYYTGARQEKRTCFLQLYLGLQRIYAHINVGGVVRLENKHTLLYQ